MHILMLSSSRVNNCDYLAAAKNDILTHLGAVSECLFVPYAGISTSYDTYTEMVQHALPELSVIGLHTFDNEVQAITRASQNNQAILVGGGNTFHLLYTLQKLGLMPIIQEQVINQDVPYIGWSAGSNICGATIRTTNDMPIIEPPSFTALNFVSCQLNPHYTDDHPKDFHGETRDQRLTEFVTLHPDIPVIGIREGSALRLTGTKKEPNLELSHDYDGVLFTQKNGKSSLPAGSNLTYLI